MREGRQNQAARRIEVEIQTTAVAEKQEILKQFCTCDARLHVFNFRLLAVISPFHFSVGIVELHRRARFPLGHFR